MIRVTRGYGLLEKFLAKKRYTLANKFISGKARDGKILDVGCGQYPYFLINTNFKDKYGIDLHASGSFNGIKLLKLNAEKDRFPFKDNSFNVVTMLAVFEHVNPESINFL